MNVLQNQLVTPTAVFALLCCSTGKTAFALDGTFSAGWGHKWST